MESQPTTTAPAITQGFSITTESVQQLLSFLQQGQKVAVQELQQVQPIVMPAHVTPEKLAELSQVKDAYVEKLAKSKKVYEKMKAKRMEFTDPIKEKLMQIMQFENALDPQKDNNEYAKARKVIEAFDQEVLHYTKVQQEKAEMEKRTNQYKVDLRTAVERKLLEMITGQQKLLTEGMIKWEAGLTLENIATKEQALRGIDLKLNKEKYDGCFHTNFPMNKNLLSEEETKTFIEGLKVEFTYEAYNERYLQIAAPIKNAYLAKLPDVKANLEAIKGNQEAEEKRKAELEAQKKSQLAAIDQSSQQAQQEIAQRQDMGHMEAEFIAQGTTQDLPQQATKKVATFENDALWLQPLLQVIAHVASNKMKPIKNSKGEYIPAIQWWLTQFESCHNGKIIQGLKLEDEAKTTIRKK